MSLKLICIFLNNNSFSEYITMKFNIGTHQKIKFVGASRIFYAPSTNYLLTTVKLDYILDDIKVVLRFLFLLF